MAAILFKNTIHANVLSRGRQTGGFDQSAWFQLADDTRGHIRAALLGNLTEPDESLLKDLCTCISAIACVEVPTGHWADYVDTMAG